MGKVIAIQIGTTIFHMKVMVEQRRADGKGITVQYEGDRVWKRNCLKRPRKFIMLSSRPTK